MCLLLRALPRTQIKLRVLLYLRFGPRQPRGQLREDLASVGASLEPVSGGLSPSSVIHELPPLGQFNPLVGSSAVNFVQPLQPLNEVAVRKH